MSEELVYEIRDIAKQGKEAVYNYFVTKGWVEPQLVDKITSSSKKGIIGENYPYDQKMPRSIYEKEKRKLQIELVKFQKWFKDTGKRLIILFEGRDAAGKGGTIKRITEHLNPRGARVVALEKPTDKERGQWYFQRYINHFPSQGEIVMFDRSWYNRAGVEKVMNFCSQADYDNFLTQAPIFEQMIQSSDIHLIKFWFSVSREEQIRRFVARIVDPIKQWKISPMDLASLGRWEDYTRAKENMFMKTDNKGARWIVVRSDCKKRARLNAMSHILRCFDYRDAGQEYWSCDGHILGFADHIYEADEWLLRDTSTNSRL